ncbi:hypothetical protein PV325_007332 [Microctonus aethiopoides]|nr:hypothetical protein PV325_007332 [Microctonus aethiopoides]KAK0096315.1 hypothetical protein PV326_005826 [Microctonus aethiopoides]
MLLGASSRDDPGCPSKSLLGAAPLPPKQNVIISHFKAYDVGNGHVPISASHLVELVNCSSSFPPSTSNSPRPIHMIRPDLPCTKSIVTSSNRLPTRRNLRERISVGDWSRRENVEMKMKNK